MQNPDHNDGLLRQSQGKCVDAHQNFANTLCNCLGRLQPRDTLPKSPSLSKIRGRLWYSTESLDTSEATNGSFDAPSRLRKDIYQSNLRATRNVILRLSAFDKAFVVVLETQAKGERQTGVKSSTSSSLMP